METLTFPTKRDTWLVVVIWFAVAISCAAIVATWIKGGARSGTLFATLATGAVVALMLSVLYGTKYVVDGDRLRIRSGPLRWTIEIRSIESIRPTNDPISSPACSLDRLEIARDDGRMPVMISPAEKSAFLDAIASRDPQLVRHDSSLERARR